MWAQRYVFKHIGPTTCRVTSQFRALEEGSELKLQLPKPQGACAHSDTLLPLPSGFRTPVLTLKAQCGTGLTPNQQLYSLSNSHPPEQGGGEVTVTGPQICDHKPQHLHRKHKPCFSQPPTTSLRSKQSTVSAVCCGGEKPAFMYAPKCMPGKAQIRW